MKQVADLFVHLGTRSRTVDYVTDFEGISYTEILAITVADVLVFGKPSINFTYVETRIIIHVKA